MKQFTINLNGYEYVIAAASFELAHLEAIAQHLELGRKLP